MVLGLIGVASLLLSNLPIETLQKAGLEVIPPETLRLLLLINPVFLLLVMVTIGTLTYDKVKLSVPVVEKMLGKPNPPSFLWAEIVKQGTLLGILAGGLIIGTVQLFYPYLPPELNDLTKSAELNVVTKVLYGGITEELLTRFGLMSFFAWLLFKATKRLNAFVYWTAIALAALLFALGHFPILYQLVPNPTVAT